MNGMITTEILKAKVNRCLQTRQREEVTAK
jgi:hypothetical protein